MDRIIARAVEIATAQPESPTWDVLLGIAEELGIPAAAMEQARTEIDPSPKPVPVPRPMSERVAEVGRNWGVSVFVIPGKTELRHALRVDLGDGRGLASPRCVRPDGPLGRLQHCKPMDQPNTYKDPDPFWGWWEWKPEDYGIAPPPVLPTRQQYPAYSRSEVLDGLISCGARFDPTPTIPTATYGG